MEWAAERAAKLRRWALADLINQEIAHYQEVSETGRLTAGEVYQQIQD
jgi:hypothetical protein